MNVNDYTVPLVDRRRDTPMVFVVDDDASARGSLELMIRAAGWQPKTFASAQAFLARPPVLAPSCLVLDMTVADLSGLDLQQFAADRTELPIICMASHADVPTTVRAMKAGAVDFLIKPFRYDVLLSAVQCAIERSFADLAHQAALRELRNCYASLSLRERQVLALVVAGRLNKQIGVELGITEITVKVHRGRMMRKMSAFTLPDLVNMAARLGVAPARKADARRRLLGARDLDRGLAAIQDSRMLA